MHQELFFHGLSSTVNLVLSEIRTGPPHITLMLEGNLDALRVIRSGTMFHTDAFHGFEEWKPLQEVDVVQLTLRAQPETEKLLDGRDESGILEVLSEPGDLSEELLLDDRWRLVSASQTIPKAPGLPEGTVKAGIRLKESEQPNAVEIPAELLQVISSLAAENVKATIDGSFLKLKLEADGDNLDSLLVVRSDERQCLVYVRLVSGISADLRAKVCDLFARANFGLPIGVFEVDMESGDARTRASGPYVDLNSLGPIAADLWFGAESVTQTYYPALKAVLSGVSPSKAIEEAEK